MSKEEKIKKLEELFDIIEGHKDILDRLKDN